MHKLPLYFLLIAGLGWLRAEAQVQPAPPDSFKNRIEFRYKMEYSKWDRGDAVYNVNNVSHIVSLGYRFL